MASFSERVIEIVKSIPEGKVMSYAEVAARAGSPKAVRAVGSVMKANHDADVPCHRVVRKSGDIGEYNRGKDAKKSRLESEGVILDGNRIVPGIPKIVTIGGGTGSFVILSALKRFPVDITAIISMADDGGSTGILRDQYGVLPPGDIRKAIVALSESSDTLRALFNYRFKEGSLKGHNFGNLFLAVLEKVTGDFSAAVSEASSVLNIKGKVIPVTLADTTLHARLASGRVLHGESVIDLGRNFRSPISSVWLDPEVMVNPEAVRAVKEADLLVICPGSPYTSVIPNFLVSGFREAVAASAAKKVYIMNLMTKNGETDGMKASDFIKSIEKYAGEGIIDYVIANNKMPSRSTLDLYKKERARPILPPRKRSGGPVVVKGDFIARGELIRHDPEGKLAEVLLSLMISDRKPRP